MYNNIIHLNELLLLFNYNLIGEISRHIIKAKFKHLIQQKYPNKVLAK